MIVETLARRGRACGAILALALAAAGTGGAAHAQSISEKLGGLLPFSSPRDRNAPPAGATRTTDCPIVQIEPGMSAVRVGGADSSSVRYQIAIGDVARDCIVENGQVLTRVGVETRVIIGPAGSPGTYTATLRVSLRKTRDEQVLASKTYRVGGAVGSSGTALTSLVAEPLGAPYINDYPSEDYEIVLAISQGGGEPTKAKRRKRR